MEIKGFRKCDGCFTAKVVMGLGMVEMKCPTCKGVGYLEQVDDEIAYLEAKKAFDNVDVPNSIVFDTEPSKEVFDKILPVVKGGEVFVSSPILNEANVINMEDKKNFKTKKTENK